MKGFILIICTLFLCVNVEADLEREDRPTDLPNFRFACWTIITYGVDDDVTGYFGDFSCKYNGWEVQLVSIDYDADPPTPFAYTSAPYIANPCYTFETISMDGITWARMENPQTVIGLPHDKSVNRTCQSATPIIIDMNQNGIHLGQKDLFVDFDYFGFGFVDSTQWVAVGGDEAFLALDLNSNGVVDDGSELFGSGTWLINEGTWASNGFLGLAQYDDPSLGGDDDELITENDDICQRPLTLTPSYCLI